MNDILNDKLSLDKHGTALARIKEIEKVIKDQGDEIIWIITTRDTNPMIDCVAIPMSMKDIKNK